MHPYQQTFFNFLAGENPMLNFEGDYLGLGYRKGFEWIVDNDNRDTIQVIATQSWEDRHLLPNHDKSSLKFIMHDFSQYDSIIFICII